MWPDTFEEILAAVKYSLLIFLYSVLFFPVTSNIMKWGQAPLLGVIKMKLCQEHLLKRGFLFVLPPKGGVLPPCPLFKNPSCFNLTKRNFQLITDKEIKMCSL